MIYRILILVAFLPFIAKAQFQDHHQNRAIGAKEKQLVIDSLIHTLKEGYVYPEIAKQIETKLNQLVAKGSYRSIDSAQAFCDTLSNQLMQWSDDKHLRLAFSYDTITGSTAENPPLPDFIRDFAVKNNYGFNKIQILDGNIGYINILGFFPMEEATQKGIACMEYIADTRAVIIDLRENSGGFGAFCNFMISYFFSSNPVHLLDMNFRRDQKIEQSWSSFYVPGKRFLNKPVYVLTSASTFSAGEAFAYILQTEKRAMVIGEVTGGGANIGTLVKLSPHFVINLPTGTVVSPLTHKGWEKYGVQPDIKVNAGDALKVAHERALSDLDYLRKK
jgi:hypothetical protein